VIEDPLDPNNLVLEIPPELCAELGWVPGDQLEWSQISEESCQIFKTPTQQDSQLRQ